MDFETDVETAAQDAFKSLFGKIGADRARRVVNVLMESPFFYRDDDVDLFGVLKRRRSVFREFFEAFFGWDLYVDDYVARLIKPKVFNTELRPTQRHVFRLSGRQEYVLFVLLLEFHQRQADEQNLDLDACDEVRFVLADFIDFVFKRFQEQLGDDAPSEEGILDGCRSLFKTLEKYRFIAERERIGVVAEAGIKAGFTKAGKSDVLYALLPGLRCYRAEALSKADILGAPAVDEGENAEEDERIEEVAELDTGNAHQEEPISPAASEETEP
ncbi:MAG: DUF2398 family protein [Pirellulaceae bacterium]